MEPRERRPDAGRAGGVRRHRPADRRRVAGPRRRCSGPATTRRWCRRPTAGSWCPPTCSSRDGTFGWTGRRRTTSAARRSPRTPPTSRRWARDPTGFVVAFGAPADTPRRPGRSSWPTGCGRRRARVGAGIVGGDLVSSPQWVVSVTVLGDLGGRRAGHARRCDSRLGGRRLRRARPVSRRVCRCWRVGTFADSTSCAAVTWCRSRRTVRAWRPPKPARGAMTDISDGLIADLRHVADGVGRRNRAVDGRRWPPTGDAVADAAAELSASTRGRGCSAAARTTRWSPSSPAGCPPAGG